MLTYARHLTNAETAAAQPDAAHLLNGFYASGGRTLLAVGPMSKNCVDAAVQTANHHEFPLVLVASRRQIECREFGGGYVNGWSTEDFADYVRRADRKRCVLLERDHGGPWQNDFEKEQGLGFASAMESAMYSFFVDIQAGLDIIHIDPSIDIHRTLTVPAVLQRIETLLHYCHRESLRTGNTPLFEVGAEEQTETVGPGQDLEVLLDHLQAFCQPNGVPFPAFVVVQGGTKVVESTNVGVLESTTGKSVANVSRQVSHLIRLCERYGTRSKLHNCDYLSGTSIALLPRLGVHSINIAPELGVVETRAFIACLRSHGMSKQADDFIALAYNSQKWAKWMLPDTSTTDLDKALIAGHYVFATPEFQALKRQAEKTCARKGVDLDRHLRNAVGVAILRYARLLGLVEEQTTSHVSATSRHH